MIGKKKGGEGFEHLLHFFFCRKQGQEMDTVTYRGGYKL